MLDAQGKIHIHLYLVSSVSGRSLQTKVKRSELSCLNYQTGDGSCTNIDLRASLGSGTILVSALSTSLVEPAESIARGMKVP